MASASRGRGRGRGNGTDPECMLKKLFGLSDARAL